MTDIEREHLDLVLDLCKKPKDISDQLSYQAIDLWHQGTGISTEAGELLSAIKCVAIYNRPIDQYNVIEELGDLEFYMAKLRSILNIKREDTLIFNMSKLKIRYSGGYSNEAAAERKDKVV